MEHITRMKLQTINIMCLVIRRVIVCLIVLFGKPVLATEGGGQSRFSSSVGAGVQYAGIIGYQIATKSRGLRIHASLGVLGIAGGFNKLVGENVSVGFNLFYLGLVGGYSANANYYFGSTFDKGWMLGIDLFNAANYLGTSSTGGLISFGYEF